MSSIVSDTLAKLRSLRERHDSVVCFFSGGKDSLCVAQLATRVWPGAVHCATMWYIPGLDCLEEQLERANERFKFASMIQLPHWAVAGAIRESVYCFPTMGSADIDESDYTLADAYECARQETGARLILTGARRTDSLWRRRMLVMQGKPTDELDYPVVDWSKFDVLAFLRVNKIPLPTSMDVGVDLSTPGLLDLFDKYPRDFDKLCAFFPFARAVVKRRELQNTAWKKP